MLIRTTTSFSSKITPPNDAVQAGTGSNRENLVFKVIPPN